MSEAKRARSNQESQETEEPDNALKKQRSPVWWLFVKADDGKHATCRVCGDSVHCSGGTGNLRRHLSQTNAAGNLLHPKCAVLWKRLELQVNHNKTAKDNEAVDLGAWVEDQLRDINKQKQQSTKKVSCHLRIQAGLS